ncbi:unannotated protein [freshwater metagenome]|uniref:Unannotated protein n=1 Tax=freshwater metagenome TaxID=449393 RepID=A0A6J6UYX7_9ZZZZ
MPTIVYSFRSAPHAEPFTGLTFDAVDSGIAISAGEVRDGESAAYSALPPTSKTTIAAAAPSHTDRGRFAVTAISSNAVAMCWSRTESGAGATSRRAAPIWGSSSSSIIGCSLQVLQCRCVSDVANWCLGSPRCRLTGRGPAKVETALCRQERLE